MRILKLSFDNINSLCGHFEIDFTDAAYQTQGLFAITGPTGSGKSSILDALTLALYGTTVRLENLKQKSKDIKNEEACPVLTKNQSYCQAQVVFEVNGRVWLSRWSRKKGVRSLRLGEPKVELVQLAHVNDTNGTIIAEKKREFDEAIVRIVGMNFEAFTRSVLLAQGAFANLLHAKVDERADLLERLTGTEIYSYIGQAVYQKAQAGKAAFEALEMQLKHLEVLSSEERQALTAQCEQIKADITTKELDLKNAQAALTQLQAYQKAKAQCDVAQQRHMHAQLRATQVKGYEVRLNASRRAQAPMTAFAVWHQAEETYKALQASLTTLEAKSTVATSQVKHFEQTVQALQAQADAAQKAYIHYDPIYGAAVALETQIGATVDKLQADQQSYDELRATCTRECEALEQALQSLTQLESTLASLPAPLTADEEATRRQLWAQLRAAWPQLVRLADEKEAATKAFDAHQSQQDRLQSHLEATTQRYEADLATATQAQTTYEATQTLWSQCIDTQTMKQKWEAFACATQKCWAYEWLMELRTQATLTQSAIHAWQASAQTPTPTALTDLQARQEAAAQPLLALVGQSDWQAFNAQTLAQLQAQVATLKSWGQTVDDAQHAFKRAQLAASQAQATLVTSEKAWRQAKEKCQAWQTERAVHQAKVEQLCASFEAALSPFLERLTPIASIHTWAQLCAWWPQAQARECERERVATQTQKAQEAYLKAQQHVALIQARVAPLQERVKAFEQSLQVQKQQLAVLQQTQAEKFGLDNPHAKRQALKDRMMQTQRDWQAREGQLQAQQAAATRLAATLEEKKAQCVTQAALCQQLGSQAQASLVTHGFTDYEEVLKVALKPEEAQALQAQVEEAQQQLAACQATFKEAQATLEALCAQLPRGTEDDWQHKMEGLQQALDQARQMLGRLLQTCEIDDQRHEKAKAIEAQQRELEATQGVYRQLNALIGSADGAVFKRYAQRLTLELLLNHANVILQRMHARYALCVMGELGLDIAVQDLDLAGMTRTSFNLSGGETFLVSLALALSLSQLSARHLQVDTLFLDEGFGTLDAKTLERALQALERLQQLDNKLIGVISHVQAVSERMLARIEVIPLGGSGHSQLAGPGVTMRT